MHVQRAALQPVGLHLQEALLQRGGVQRCVVGWHGRRGKRRKFCSQLVVASIMIGRLCKVLWACAVQRRGRGGPEEGERGRRGSLTGRPLRSAINSCIRNDA